MRDAPTDVLAKAIERVPIQNVGLEIFVQGFVVQIRQHNQTLHSARVDGDSFLGRDHADDAAMIHERTVIDILFIEKHVAVYVLVVIITRDRRVQLDGHISLIQRPLPNGSVTPATDQIFQLEVVQIHVGTKLVLRILFEHALAGFPATAAVSAVPPGRDEEDGAADDEEDDDDANADGHDEDVLLAKRIWMHDALTDHVAERQFLFDVRMAVVGVAVGIGAAAPQRLPVTGVTGLGGRDADVAGTGETLHVPTALTQHGGRGRVLVDHVQLPPRETTRI